MNTSTKRIYTLELDESEMRDLKRYLGAARSFYERDNILNKVYNDVCALLDLLDSLD
jgi:hypothetical protein